MKINKDFLLLQLNDALFPIGSYTHSFGLETYIQMGKVSDKHKALEYLRANLLTQFLHTELLSLKLSFENTIQKNLDKILEIEELICVSTSPLELRVANQKLGNRFLKTIQNFPIKWDEFFTDYIQKTKFSTHSTAYGVFCASTDLDLKTALYHYLYAQSSNMVTNCVKTIPLSQNDGQKILLELQGTFEQALEILDDLDINYLCASSIHNDIKAMQHERLYSRLYMS